MRIRILQIIPDHTGSDTLASRLVVMHTWTMAGLAAGLLLLADTDNAGPGLGVHIAGHLVAQVLVVVAVRHRCRVT